MNNQNIIWIIIAVLVIGAIAFVSTRGASNQPTEETTVANTTPSPSPSPSPTATTQPVVEGSCVRNYDPSKPQDKPVAATGKLVTLTVRGYGDIVVEPNTVAAPKTSENFVKLAESGFYNCLTFHRLSNLTGDPKKQGRIIQGGDPEGTGRGGPGYTVPAEIGLPHVKGAIAMARTGDAVNPKRESSGSQFYIAVDAVPFLDNQYTVFGQIVSGQDVADKISRAEILGGGLDGSPVQPIVIEKVTVTEKK